MSTESGDSNKHPDWVSKIYLTVPCPKAHLLPKISREFIHIFLIILLTGRHSDWTTVLSSPQALLCRW